jgi:hypothetical protein
MSAPSSSSFSRTTCRRQLDNAQLLVTYTDISVAVLPGRLTQFDLSFSSVSNSSSHWGPIVAIGNIRVRFGRGITLIFVRHCYTGTITPRRGMAKSNCSVPTIDRDYAHALGLMVQSDATIRGVLGCSGGIFGPKPNGSTRHHLRALQPIKHVPAMRWRAWAFSDRRVISLDV